MYLSMEKLPLLVNEKAITDRGGSDMLVTQPERLKMTEIS